MHCLEKQASGKLSHSHTWKTSIQIIILHAGCLAWKNRHLANFLTALPGKQAPRLSSGMQDALPGKTGIWNRGDRNNSTRHAMRPCLEKQVSRRARASFSGPGLPCSRLARSSAGRNILNNKNRALCHYQLNRKVTSKAVDNRGLKKLSKLEMEFLDVD